MAVVNNLSASVRNGGSHLKKKKKEMEVLSLGWEDILEKEMAPHSTILAWKIPWTEPGELQSTGPQRIRHD